MTFPAIPPKPVRARVQIEMDNGGIVEYMVDVDDIQMTYNTPYTTNNLTSYGVTMQTRPPIEVDLRLRGRASSGVWKDPSPKPIPVPHFATPEQAQLWLDAQAQTG